MNFHHLAGVQGKNPILHLDSRHRIIFITWSPGAEPYSAPGFYVQKDVLSPAVQGQNDIFYLDSRHRIIFITWSPGAEPFSISEF